MKNLFPKSFVVLASVLSLSGCGKNLHVNIPSAQNMQQPAQMIALPSNNLNLARDGQNGTKLTLGIVNPTAVTGNLGDVYINTLTGDIFDLEPSGWTVKGNVKGPKGDIGAKGEDGKQGLEGVPGTSSSNKIFSGTRTPEDAAGQAGDLYINKTTTELFQKGTDGKWNLLFKMKGERDGGEVTPGLTYASGVPTGDVTPIGGSYMDTATGDYFKRLPDGTYQRVFHFGELLDGVGQPDPKTGTSGDYYFEDVSGDLYRKDADGQWKLRMHLNPNASQAKASPLFYSGEGKEGANLVPVGAVYLDKTSGDLYTKKSDGPAELSMNLKGSNGSTILTGKGSPEKSLGSPSDYYLDSDGMMLSHKDKDGNWILIGTLMGPQGLQGIRGLPGSNGQTAMTIRTMALPPVDLPLSLENAELGFAFGKSQVDLGSILRLEKTAHLLQKYASRITEISVVGHADKYGAEHTNQNLSENRAKAVALILGKSESTLPVQNRGEGEVQISACPAANSGNQEKGEHLKCAKDRRVNINLMFTSSVTIPEKNAMIREIQQQFDGIWGNK